MDADKYFDMCFEIYLDERKALEDLFSKVSLSLSFVVVIGGVSGAMVDVRWLTVQLSQFSAIGAVSVCGAILAAAATFLLVAAAAVFLGLSIFPRNYAVPTTLNKIDEHRAQWFKHFGENENLSANEQKAQAWEKTEEAIRAQLVASATDFRTRTNRRKFYYNWTNRLAVAALLPLGLQAVCSLSAHVHLARSESLMSNEKAPPPVPAPVSGPRPQAPAPSPLEMENSQAAGPKVPTVR